VEFGSTIGCIVDSYLHLTGRDSKSVIRKDGLYESEPELTGPICLDLVCEYPAGEATRWDKIYAGNLSGAFQITLQPLDWDRET
jgi:hypothetical protein